MKLLFRKNKIFVITYINIYMPERKLNNEIETAETEIKNEL